MVDKEFLNYLDRAYKQYKEYKKLEKGIKLSFQDFLLVVMVWKTEAILESLERREE